MKTIDQCYHMSFFLGGGGGGGLGGRGGGGYFFLRFAFKILHVCHLIF